MSTGGGFEAALTRGLNRSGGRVLDGKRPSKGFHYKNGPAKGLTQDQYVAKARKQYANLSDENKKKYEGIAKGNDIRSKREKGPVSRPKFDSKNSRGRRTISGPLSVDNSSAPGKGLAVAPTGSRRSERIRREGLTPRERQSEDMEKGPVQSIKYGPSNEKERQDDIAEAANKKSTSSSSSGSKPRSSSDVVVDGKVVDPPKDKATSIADDIVQRGASAVGKAAGMLNKGREAIQDKFARATNPKPASHEGDSRRYVSGDKPAPEGYTLVGAKGDQKIYEKGAGMDAANKGAAATTEAKNNAFKASIAKPTPKVEPKKELVDPLSQPGVRDTNRKIQQGLMPKSVSRGAQKEWQGNLSKKREAYDNAKNGIAARPEAFNKQSESVREGKIDDHLAKKGHNVAKFSSLQRPSIKDFNKKPQGHTPLGR